MVIFPEVFYLIGMGAGTKPQKSHRNRQSLL